MYYPLPGPSSPRGSVLTCTVAIPRDRSRNGVVRRTVRPKVLPGPQQAERGLAVGDGAIDRPAAGLAQWHPVDLDDLRMLLRRACRNDVRREEQVESLGEY